MNTSAVDIWNLALDMLGAGPPITSVNDGSQLGQLCARVYPVCRNEVLRAHEWNCAITRADLTQLADAPVSEYSYQYQLPVSPLCLRVLNMPEATTAVYRIEGDRLLTDEDEVSIRYIQELTDTSKYPPDLIELVALKLAETIAFKVTNDKAKEAAMFQKYEFKLMDAKAANRNEYRQPDPETSTPWVSEGR